MAWVAVDGGGTEYIYEYKPYRDKISCFFYAYKEDAIKLPQGSIEKLIGRSITWNDEPVELE